MHTPPSPRHLKNGHIGFLVQKDAQSKKFPLCLVSKQKKNCRYDHKWHRVEQFVFSIGWYSNEKQFISNTYSLLKKLSRKNCFSDSGFYRWLLFLQTHIYTLNFFSCKCTCIFVKKQNISRNLRGYITKLYYKKHQQKQLPKTVFRVYFQQYKNWKSEIEFRVLSTVMFVQEIISSSCIFFYVCTVHFLFVYHTFC